MYIHIKMIKERKVFFVCLEQGFLLFIYDEIERLDLFNAFYTLVTLTNHGSCFKFCVTMRRHNFFYRRSLCVRERYDGEGASVDFLIFGNFFLQNSILFFEHYTAFSVLLLSNKDLLRKKICTEQNI